MSRENELEKKDKSDANRTQARNVPSGAYPSIVPTIDTPSIEISTLLFCIARRGVTNSEEGVVASSNGK